MGDKCSKAYFDFYKGYRKRMLISKLHQDGNILKKPKDIQNAISNYYHKLYSKDEIVEANIQARCECFSNISKIESEEKNLSLIQPFLEVDLFIALQDLPNDQVPGLDGVHPEFFTKLWEDIKGDLVIYINSILAQGSVGPQLFKAIYPLHLKNEL